MVDRAPGQGAPLAGPPARRRAADRDHGDARDRGRGGGGTAVVVSFAAVSAQQPTVLLRVLAACAGAIAVAALRHRPVALAQGAARGGAGVRGRRQRARARTRTRQAGFMMAARILQWLAVYAALFLSARAARWFASAITLGCASAVAGRAGSRHLRRSGDHVRDGVARDAAAERARRAPARAGGHGPPHRPPQPQRLHEGWRTASTRSPDAPVRRSRSRCSTSTASSTSTTSTATLPATACSPRWLAPGAERCDPGTCSRASAATSSS